MKRFLHFAALAIVAASCLTAVAQQAPVRSSAVQQGLMRITRPERAAIARHKAPQRAAQETVVTVPFTHTLGGNEKTTNTALYTSIDANGDGRTWKIGGFNAYSVCMSPKADGIDAMDDYLVSPAVQLEAGEQYLLSFEARPALTSAKYSDKIELKMGSGATADQLTTELVPVTTLAGGGQWHKITKTFTVEQSGTYHFGFHGVSDKATSGNLAVCNFSIVKASEVVEPAAAGTISYTLRPKGELKADVSYTAPTTTTSGSELKSISKVVITGGDYKTVTLTNVAPGATVTAEVGLYNGNNTIKAVAYQTDANGKDVAGATAQTASFYAGLDNPQTPTNVKAALSADGKKVTISWDAVPDVGESGGYVDQSKVVYYIFNAFGSIYDPAIATTTGTSIELDYSKQAEQDFVAFQVTAGMDETYYSLAANTNILAVGDPYELPFYDSFTNGKLTYPWCVDPASSNGVLYNIYNDNQLQTNADDPDASPTYLNSEDGDNGFLFVLPSEKDDVWSMFSGKIDISKAQNPVLEFFYQGKGSALDALVATDGGDFAVAHTIDLKQAPTEGWTLAQVPLTAYAKSKFVQVELRLRAKDNDDSHTWSVPIDNIRVRDLVDADLRLITLNVPTKADAGSEVKVKALVENLGTKAAEGATATLYRNGKQSQQLAIASMQPNDTASVTFADRLLPADPDTVTYKVIIALPGDADASNDALTTGVAVKWPAYPTPTGLTATASGLTANLSWTPIDASALTAPQTVTEDFENPEYEPLTISDFGDWHMVDGDGLKTYYIKNLGETNNPYQTMPQAFQLYNPYVAGVQEDYLIDVPPHSGNQFLIGWSAQGQNDNWLISPVLSGKAQTIDFWARSFTIAYPESFEVLYSTTDRDVASFKAVTVENYPANGEVPEQWTEFHAALPEGAKYFAIRQTSNDTYALYIDDITFERGSTLPADIALEGYNVYCNNVKVNDAPISEAAFAHEQRAAGTFSYRVSAVYNHGESRLSDAVTVKLEASGVETIDASEQSPASYYNLQGVRLSKEQLSTGVYIKLQNGKAQKVVVK